MTASLITTGFDKCQRLFVMEDDLRRLVIWRWHPLPPKCSPSSLVWVRRILLRVVHHSSRRWRIVERIRARRNHATHVHDSGSIGWCRSVSRVARNSRYLSGVVIVDHAVDLLRNQVETCTGLAVSLCSGRLSLLLLLLLLWIASMLTLLRPGNKRWSASIRGCSSRVSRGIIVALLRRHHGVGLAVKALLLLREWIWLEGCCMNGTFWNL